MRRDEEGREKKTIKPGGELGGLRSQIASGDAGQGEDPGRDWKDCSCPERRSPSSG